MAAPSPRVVTRDEWLAARRDHLQREKELTRLRDRVSAERRELPWVLIEKDYAFDTPRGRRSLVELFDGRSQLAVYHFMFGPDWEQGCPSCSLLSDHTSGAVAHVAQRDVTLVAVSRAPLARIEEFRARMGWTFPWYSSEPSDFNRDFHVSFADEDRTDGAVDYNFGRMPFDGDELPGLSVFAKDETGQVFHTYSAYARGLDMLIGAYHWLDLVPKGRDEAELPYTMAWVRHHDRYGEAG